ncbi:transposase [Streptomyces sp. NBC_00827]|uniref:transposase n=1 Tax=Streptomyces sp. NBC_00827 TaxID=2903677 RepID=UPI00386C150C|nr:transposase [Streptomyces sp. NBC_00827]
MLKDGARSESWPIAHELQNRRHGADQESAEDHGSAQSSQGRLPRAKSRSSRKPALPPPAPGRSTFEATRLLTTRPERLDEDQRVFVKHLLERPQLRTLHGLARSFREVFVEKRAVLMDRWITSARQSGLAPLVRFTADLLDDLDSLHAAVTLPYNSGAAEGRIIGLKMIKRQMAGRAGIQLANR